MKPLPILKQKQKSSWTVTHGLIIVKKNTFGIGPVLQWIFEHRAKSLDAGPSGGEGPWIDHVRLSLGFGRPAHPAHGLQVHLGPFHPMPIGQDKPSADPMPADQPLNPVR
jgi:hypothetical protein